MPFRGFKKLDIHPQHQPFTNQRPWAIAGLVLAIVFLIFVFCAYCAYEKTKSNQKEKIKSNVQGGF